MCEVSKFEYDILRELEVSLLVTVHLPVTPAAKQECHSLLVVYRLEDSIRATAMSKIYHSRSYSFLLFNYAVEFEVQATKNDALRRCVKSFALDLKTNAKLHAYFTYNPLMDGGLIPKPSDATLSQLRHEETQQPNHDWQVQLFANLFAEAREHQCRIDPGIGTFDSITWVSGYEEASTAILFYQDPVPRPAAHGPVVVFSGPLRYVARFQHHLYHYCIVRFSRAIFGCDLHRVMGITYSYDQFLEIPALFSLPLSGYSALDTLQVEWIVQFTAHLVAAEAAAARAEAQPVPALLSADDMEYDNVLGMFTALCAAASRLDLVKQLKRDEADWRSHRFILFRDSRHVPLNEIGLAHGRLLGPRQFRQDITAWFFELNGGGYTSVSEILKTWASDIDVRVIAVPSCELVAFICARAPASGSHMRALGTSRSQMPQDSAPALRAEIKKLREKKTALLRDVARCEARLENLKPPHKRVVHTVCLTCNVPLTEATRSSRGNGAYGPRCKSCVNEKNRERRALKQNPHTLNS